MYSNRSIIEVPSHQFIAFLPYQVKAPEIATSLQYTDETHPGMNLFHLVSSYSYGWAF